MEAQAPQTPAAELLAEIARQAVRRERPVRLGGLRGAARAFAAAELVRAHGSRPVLLLVPTAKAGDAFAVDLRAALGEGEDGDRVRAFPRHDTQPYERFSPQPFVVAQRMEVLYRWLQSDHAAADAEPAPVVVAPWSARVPCASSGCAAPGGP